MSPAMGVGVGVGVAVLGGQNPHCGNGSGIEHAGVASKQAGLGAHVHPGVGVGVFGGAVGVLVGFGVGVFVGTGDLVGVGLQIPDASGWGGFVVPSE
jgi:hypothetical protein